MYAYDYIIISGNERVIYVPLYYTSITRCIQRFSAASVHYVYRLFSTYLIQFLISQHSAFISQDLKTFMSFR